MPNPTTLLTTLLAKTDFFQLQLLALLASLITSLLLNRSLPYFTVSAICSLTSLATLTLQLFDASIARVSTPIEITTTATFTLLLLSTTLYAMILRSSPGVLRYHAATTLACSIFLTVKTVGILYGAPLPAGLDVSGQVLRTPFEAHTAVFKVDRLFLIATGFAAMHLLSALLMVHELSQSLTREENCREDDHSGGNLIEEKVGVNV